MKYITDLNRDRNQEIIVQAKEINKLLTANNITPIFLKGTANLLDGLYEDIGERMVGDIDFLVSSKEANIISKLLIEQGYQIPPSYNHSSHRHLPRLTKESKIAAIEIHIKLIREQFSSQFNYNKIIKTHIKKNTISYLSYENQLVYTILAKQINDNGYKLNTISLRNIYDCFLLSKKTNTLKAIKTLPFFFDQTNSHLAFSSLILNKPDTIIYEKNKKTVKELETFIFLLNNKSYAKIRYRFLKQFLYIKQKLPIIFSAFLNKSDRKFVFNKILNLKWNKEKLNPKV